MTPLRVVKARMIVVALENVVETIIMVATSDDRDPPPYQNSEGRSYEVTLKAGVGGTGGRELRDRRERTT